MDFCTTRPTLPQTAEHSLSRQVDTLTCMRNDAVPDDLGHWAHALRDAAATGDRLAPPDQLPQLRTGYAIQDAARELALSAGGRHAGYKIGVTATGGQRLYATDEPVRGYLLDQMLHRPHDSWGQTLRAPRVEAEIAFVIGEPLPDGELTRDELLAFVSHLQIALEIVDSRWDPDPHSVALLVADNVMCAGVVVGVSQPTDALDLREVVVSMSVGGLAVSGDSSAVLGDPVRALGWLAQSLRRSEKSLQPGDFVMSGTLCPATPVRLGDKITADFGPLGTLRTTLG